MIDRILYNGRIRTQHDQQPNVSALAISGGRVVAFGSDDAILPLASAQTRRENLTGRYVVPGLTDAHIHWEGTARALSAVNVFEVPSKREAVERVAARALQTSHGEWIRGGGWSQEYWDDKSFPTASDLDLAAPHHPVYLTAKSGHAGWVNTAALRQCGITDSTPDPEGGRIVRNESGQPTGLLFETAMDLVADRIPKPTIEQLAEMMRSAQALALASGLTGLHDFDNPSCLKALQVLRERGELGLRVVKNINKNWLPHALETGIRWGFGDDWLRFGGLKLFADGALGPRTAYMIEAYEGEPDNFGVVVVEKEDMLDLVSQASAAGLPATIHAIGDRAVHDVLDIYEVVRKQEQSRGIRPDQRRHRIEHVQIIHPQDKHRLAELQVIASMQPLHATSDYEMSDRYWGKRSEWAYNPRLQLDQGVVLALGSDSPVEPFEPLKSLYAAVSRRRPDGSPGPEGWYPDARLTIDEALRGYTIGPAYAAGMEDRLGRLSPGYLADLVVLDRNLESIAPEEILETSVIATMVGGEWRYGGI